MASLFVLLTTTAPSAAPACSVQVAPRFAPAPLQYLRSHVTVEPDDRVVQIDLVLVGEAGQVTSSLLWARGEKAAPRTFFVEWKSLREAEGIYEVWVVASRGDGSVCRATSGPITVS